MYNVFFEQIDCPQKGLLFLLKSNNAELYPPNNILQVPEFMAPVEVDVTTEQQ